jgi:endo-1,4-beta-mannosidase
VGDYHLLNFTGTNKQLEILLTKFKNHEAILAWDLKNEPDLDYKYHDADDVQEWLKFTIKKAKSYDPNHLMTIGWAYPENADFMNNEVDFVSFHSYKSPEELANGIDVLSKKVSNKPLVLEEFGLSTYKGIWSPSGADEQEQAAYFAKVKTVLKQKGNIPFMVWTLYDFTEIPENVVGKLPWNRQPQTGFGLITAEGKIKIGAKVLAND